MVDVAVVTGAGGDIGTECALALADSVDAVLCIDRSAESLDRLAQRLDSAGHRGVPVVADAADPGFGALVARTAIETGDVRTVVHGIAFEEHTPAKDVSLDSVVRSFTVGPLAALSLFREIKAVSGAGVRPTFVAIGSLHADHAFADCVGYNAAHAALKAVVKTLAHEWARDGIRVNAVAPGWIRTEGEVRMYGADHLDGSAAGLPFQKMGTAAQVASGVRFLASAEASYISGTVLTVDGALSASLARLPAGGSE